MASATVPTSGYTLPGWLRTITNTGISAAGLVEGDLSTYSGGLTITTTVTRKVIDCGSSSLVLGTGGALIECIIRGTAARQIWVIGTGQSITRCNLEANGDTTGGAEVFGLYAGSYDAGFGTYVKGLHISSLYHTGGTIGIWHDGADATDDAYIDSWYLASMSPGTGHHDGFTRREGNGPITIRNSRVNMNTDATTGAIFLQDTWSGTNNPAVVGHITLQDNYFQGNGYCLTLEECNNITVTNNRFTPTGYGPVTTTTVTSLTWSSNYNYAAAPPDYQGTVISSP